MENLQKAYDTVVGVAMVNLYTLAKENGAINFGGFDQYDEEHLFLLKVAVTSYGVMQQPIRFNLPIWKRKRIAAMMGNSPAIDWKKRAKKNECFDTGEVLDFMRPVGTSETGDEWFMFSDIYHEYYTRKEEENA